jgi:hypothetical protein
MALTFENFARDNRIWNEQTQAKETVWKAPFIEETSLPEVLVVQLKRFKINMTWDGRVETLKLNTKVEFGDTLNLSEYVRRQKDEFDAVEVANGAHVYELQGIVVHSGQSVNSGHYYSFINSNIVQQVGNFAHLSPHANAEPVSQTPKQAAARGSTRAAWERGGIWYKLDDQTVTKVSEDTIKQESFGGTLESKDQFGDVKRQAHSRSAYVLFYRKRPSAEAQSASAPALSFPAEPARSGQGDGAPNGVGSKRQRVSKAQRQSTSSNDTLLRHPIAEQQRLDLGLSAAETLTAVVADAVTKNDARNRVAVEHGCPASVQEASLSAALHVLAFDKNFIKWVEDLVRFARTFMQKELQHSSDALKSRLPKAEVALSHGSRGDSALEAPATINSSSSSSTNRNSNKSILSDLNSTISPRRGNSRRAEHEMANIELAVAAGIRFPPELAAKICDMAVLTLAHVAARTDSNQQNQPPWELVRTLFDEAEFFLEASPQGSVLFLRRACARCAALQGEGATPFAEGTEDTIKQSISGAGVWRSWIETLLLKHPEEKVREGFHRLLKKAICACAAAADAAPAPGPAAAGKYGVVGPRSSHRRKSAPMSAGDSARAAAGALKVPVRKCVAYLRPRACMSSTRVFYGSTR